MVTTGVVFGWAVRPGRGPLIFIAMILGALVHPVAVAAAPSDVRRYEIPAQPLAGAIEAYSRANGLQVLYDSALAADQQSAAIDGEMTADAALRQMLAGSGLGILYTESRDVVIMPIERIEAASLAAAGNMPVLELDPLHVDGAPEIGLSDEDRRRFRTYSMLIRDDVRRFLVEHDDPGSKGYNIGLDVWIDEAGRISRTRVFRTSGNAGQDNLVAAALVGLALREPPPWNMPQPANVIIAVKPL